MCSTVSPLKGKEINARAFCLDVAASAWYGFRWNEDTDTTLMWAAHLNAVLMCCCNLS